jgi:Rps23 Pro-64 3,4-dihydroxylase Tpa1-like proline 4-hydroxylase
MTQLDFEILDFGLVYYKNMLKNPQEIIDAVNSIDTRFSNGEHGNNFTDVRSWTAWKDDHLPEPFNYQKFLPQSDLIDKNDYYYSEQLDISNKLYEALDIAADHYTNVLYPLAGLNIKNREYSLHLLRYDKGGHLPLHQDQGVSSRVLSSVMYLNDDYMGGEIIFPQSRKMLKPEPGSIIFFPSNFMYPHEILPIVHGSKYSMPHWYHNMRNMISSTGEA